jgi:hypothetical protein
MGAENGKGSERENCAGDVRKFGGGAEDCSCDGGEAVGGLREYCLGASGIDLSMEGESRAGKGGFAAHQNYDAAIERVGESDHAIAQLQGSGVFGY